MTITKNTNLNNIRNPHIQILRILSCLSVFTVHLGQRLNFTGTLRTFTDFGSCGVNLFFLISGFLAVSSYTQKKTSIKQYYIKRAIAILPLYYITILYFFITENIIHLISYTIPPDELGLGWFRYIFLLNGFVNSPTYFWSNLGITWTIPIFMFFYLINPWILKFVYNIYSATTAWIFIFLITKTLYTFYPCTILGSIHWPFLGIVIYYCATQKYYIKSSILFYIGILVSIILEHYPYAIVYTFAVILLACAYNPNHAFGIHQKTLNLIDSYAYTFYLSHGIVFCSILDRLNKINVSTVLIAIVAIPGSIIFTYIIGTYIEKPMQKYLKKHFLQIN